MNVPEVLRQRPRMMRTREASDLTGIGTRTLYRLCCSGQLRHMRAGRLLMIDSTDLADLIDQLSCHQTPQERTTQISPEWKEAVRLLVS